MRRFKLISRNDKAHVEADQGALPTKELAVLRQPPLAPAVEATSAFVNLAMESKLLAGSEETSHLGIANSCSLGRLDYDGPGYSGHPWVVPTIS